MLPQIDDMRMHMICLYNRYTEFDAELIVVHENGIESANEWN